MVIEKLLKEKWVKRRPSYSLFIGVIVTLISFFISFLLFRNARSFIGVSTILFTTIITIPLINKLLNLEEKIELKKKRSFFKKHEAIIDFFIYFFIGVFIVLFEIALIAPNLVFSEENLYGSKEIKIEKRESRLPEPPPLPGSEGKEVFVLFKNNFYIMIIAFALSLFYGAGALFLIILNASIFASALAKTIHATIPHLGFVFTFSFLACNLGIMFFHMVPEVIGYLLAAIGGGVLSQAFIREKIGSKNFKIVLKSSFILLIIATIVLFLAAIIENKLSKALFRANVCEQNKYMIILIFLLLSIGIIVFEMLRKRKIYKKQIKRVNN